MSEHDFRKQNLVTRSDMTDLYACEHCGLKYIRRGLSWNPPTTACPKSPNTPGNVRVKEATVSKDKKTPVTAKAEKPGKKKLTQKEWDAKFGGEDTAVAAPTPKAKTEKPATKPVAKKATKPEEKVHGRISSTNSRKLKSNIGDCTKKSYVAIAAAFGKGKTIEDAVTDLEINYEPPRSAEYAKNPRKYLLGYISTMISNKFLTEV
jgi:hypothetical protein